MRYRTFGKTGFEVSEIGFGAWAIGGSWGPQDDKDSIAALRRALDNLASAVDELYVVEAASRGVNSWPLRDAYIRVALGEATGPDLLRQHGLEALSEPQSARLLTLLEATAFCQCMYASHAFFYEDLARPETRFVIASAAHAAELAQHFAAAQRTAPAGAVR